MKLMQLLSLCFFCTAVHAQSIERKIINSAGTVYNASGVKLKVSVGEPIVGRFENTGTTVLSQGFFTGFLRSAVPPPPPPPPPVDTATQSTPEGYSVYPNPVKDILYIKGNLVFIHQVQCFDIAGHRLFTQTPGPGGTVPVRTLPPGFYIFKITNASDEVLNIFKIIKL